MLHFTLISKSRVLVNASFGVSPLRTTNNTPSVCTDKITASVAAITGGESITINLKLFLSSAMASATLWDDSRSAGLGGSGPVGIAAKFGTVGCGTTTAAKLDAPARQALRPGELPPVIVNSRPTPRLRKSASTTIVLSPSCAKVTAKVAAAVVFPSRGIALVTSITCGG